MLEEMVKAVVNKVIAQDYAFLKTPAALYAVVTKATQLGETFDYNLIGGLFARMVYEQ